MIILQDSNFGKNTLPISPYFDYLDKLDERISVTVRHRATGKNKVPGHKDDRGGDGGKKYGNIRTLVGAYKTNPPDTAGCTTFCETGPRHTPAFCPKVSRGEVTETTVHEKNLCTGCLGPKARCPEDCRNRRHVNKAGKTVYKTCPTCHKNKGLQIHQQCQQGTHDTGTLAVPQPRGPGRAAAENQASTVIGPR